MTNLLDIITPTNLEIEQDKFFRSNNYNPIFHYFWQDQKIEPTFSIQLKYPLWEAIKEQNHSAIVEASKALFEVDIIESELIDAQAVATTHGIISNGNANEYARLMQESFDQFGIDDISITLSNETGFSARPNHQKKNITISKHIHFEYFSMEGGVRHELVHILRYLNGKYNNIKRSDRFLPTEEGLASWCQDNTNNDNGHAQHAIEYVSSNIGIHGSLRDIYNKMCELGMSKELAWKRACRHKFGFVDTSKPGDILKPAMYYANEKKVEMLSTNEKLRLFNGKINLVELSDHPTYDGIWSADKIIEYFKL